MAEKSMMARGFGALRNMVAGEDEEKDEKKKPKKDMSAVDKYIKDELIGKESYTPPVSKEPEFTATESAIGRGVGKLKEVGKEIMESAPAQKAKEIIGQDQAVKDAKKLYSFMKGKKKKDEEEE